ncbi:type IX secretion system membrane protein PorP/SprF [Mariniflexile ostreae]|uniref:Type IX secretion system membrane protein PorP/SprF n=1 Tax=Mariniflexile ostreae TaxID=1520892 RepID=A0ABV5FCW3_9FLAO
MKKSYIALLVFAMLFKAPKLIAQQEIQFTQYIFNTVSVNPAYAGYKEQWFVQMALRNQWAGIEGAPKTGQFSIDGIISPMSRNMGLGLQITSDKLGPQLATSAYLNYAYRLRLNHDDTERLSFGLAAGLGQYGLDGSKFSTVNQHDTALSNANLDVWKWNVRLGVYYYNPRWYAGISMMNVLDDSENVLFKSDSDDYSIDQRRHMYFITGAVFDLSPNFKWRPSILIKDDFKGPASLDVNTMFIFNERFWFGASYRTGLKLWDKDYTDFSAQKLKISNAVSGIVQFYLSENFRVGYSYDYMLNNLGNHESGSHELTLGYTFPLQGRRLISPRFF